jgi:hypothetical protein
MGTMRSVDRRDLKEGKTYTGRKNSKLSRKIVSFEYNDWMNDYIVHYVKQTGTEWSCTYLNFRAWAAK